MHYNQFEPEFNRNFRLPSGNKRQEAIDIQIRELTQQLINTLIEGVGKTHFVYLTSADLALSISNGASPEIPVTLPGSLPKVSEFSDSFRRQLDPDGSKSDCFVVSENINPVTFLHFIEAAKKDRTIPADVPYDSLKKIIFSLEPKAIDEYHQMLTEASRFWAANPKITQTLGAEFLSLSYAQEELFNAPTFGLRSPVSLIHSRIDGGILIKYPGVSISQRILPGSSIFIAGAGLNILSNLKELRELSEFKFELNDADPFIANCLANFFHLCPVPNICVSHGKMSEVLAKRAGLDLIILSDIPNLQGDTPESLVATFQSACKPFTPVHIFQKDPEFREGFTPADHWEGWMALSHYKISVNREMSLVAGPLEHMGRDEILALGNKELLAAIEDYKDHKSTVRHRLLVANTAAN